MPDANERDDRGGFHEVKVPADTAEQGPRAVGKGARRTEGHERVHIRAARLELAPGTAIKRRTGENLDEARQRKRKPLKPTLYGQSENPLADHQWRRPENADPQIHLPAGEFVFAVLMGMDFGHARLIARF